MSAPNGLDMDLLYQDAEGTPIPLPPDIWAATPPAACALILMLLEQNRALREEVRVLREQVQKLTEQVNLNSRNSSKPPSSNPPWTPPVSKKPTGRKRGGQPGHQGHRRQLLPEDQVTQVVHHFPSRCGHCGIALSTPKEPTLPWSAHQVIEIPPVQVEVVEHRFHRVCCKDCLQKTLAPWPSDVTRGSFGPRMVSVLSLLSGRYRMSRRDVEEFCGTVLGVEISLGGVKLQEDIVSQALAPVAAEAEEAVKAAGIVNVDETPWKEARVPGYLWCANTVDLAVYWIRHGRGGETAREILGDNLDRVLGTDRLASYGFHPVKQRQICLAHLIRNLRRLLDRGGLAQSLAEWALRELQALFGLWNDFKGGLLGRLELQAMAAPIRARMGRLLRLGTQCGQRRSESAFKHMLRHFPAFWTFLRMEGVEPTNNSSERALRPGVRLRRVSFGSQSEAGSRFVERMLTAIESCRRQGRNLLEVMTQAVSAWMTGDSPPSLLPAVPP